MTRLTDLKVTKTNFLPTTELGKVPVYGDVLNRIVDWFTDNLTPSLGTLYADTITELTSDSGITIDGALIKDGAFLGKQATATATDAGLTTGALTGSNQFVTVTSANANHVICLPADSTTPVGTVIRGYVGANGFELRPIAAEAATTTINNITTSVEAAIPATTNFRVEKVAANRWVLTATDEVGAVITAIIPDAIE